MCNSLVMKSAYELAMERLNKKSPTVKLSAQQKREIAELESLMGRLERAVAVIGKGEVWRLEVVAAGQRGGAHRTPWDSLLALIEAVNRATSGLPSDNLTGTSQAT